MHVCVCVCVCIIDMLVATHSVGKHKLAYLHFSYSEQKEFNSELPRLEGTAHSHNHLGLVGNSGESVVETEEFVLLVIAVDTVDLYVCVRVSE